MPTGLGADLCHIRRNGPKDLTPSLVRRLETPATTLHSWDWLADREIAFVLELPYHMDSFAFKLFHEVAQLLFAHVRPGELNVDGDRWRQDSNAVRHREWVNIRCCKSIEDPLIDVQLLRSGRHLSRRCGLQRLCGCGHTCRRQSCRRHCWTNHLPTSHCGNLLAPFAPY